MFTTGIMVFLGVALLFIKLPRRIMLKALKYDLSIDIAVSAVVLLIHFGTFGGVMAATVAGLLTSIMTSAAKRMFGYIDGNLYYVGKWRLNVE